jgi:hypothetical protein
LGLTTTPGTIFPIQPCLNGTSACVAAPASTFRYIIQPAGANGLSADGNLGRNTFFGPGQMFYDTAVQRSFKFRERQSFTLRAEFFNTFNHPNLFTNGGVNSYDLLSPNFGDIASTINGNREIKFWLKYAF